VRRTLALSLIVVVCNLCAGAYISVSGLDVIMTLRVLFALSVPYSAWTLFVARMIERPIVQQLDEYLRDFQQFHSAQQQSSSGVTQKTQQQSSGVVVLKTKIRYICKQGELYGFLLTPLFLFYSTSSLLDSPAAALATQVVSHTLFATYQLGIVWLLSPGSGARRCSWSRFARDLSYRTQIVAPTSDG
jgi:hypothetical protein